MSQDLSREAELHRLLEAFHEHTITSEGVRRLEERLRGDVAARKLYRDYSLMAGWLYWTLRGTAAPLPEPLGAGPVQDSAVSRSPSPQWATEVGPSAPSADLSRADNAVEPGPGSYWLGFITTAVRLVPGGEFTVGTLLLTGVIGAISGLVMARRDSNQSPAPTDVSSTWGDPVATLTAPAGCVWPAGDPFTTADKNETPILRRGQALELVSGVAEVRFKDGAHVLLEGPARLTLSGAGACNLHAGRLMATVPKAAVGFEVRTPTARVVDLGTEFGVMVLPSGATEMEVFRGVIEVEAATSANPNSSVSVPKRRVVTGQAVRVGVGDAATVQLLERTSVEFVRKLPTAERPQREPQPDYARLVVERTQPKLYWDFDDPRRSWVARDNIRSYPADLFRTKAVGVPGPRAADGFAGMAPNNRALEVAGNDGLGCHYLVEKVAVQADSYSVQAWFNSLVAFDAQALHYVLGRGNGGQEADMRDSLAVVGNFPDLKATASVGQLLFCNGPPAHGSGRPIAGRTRNFGRELLGPSRWYHLTLVRRGASVKVYLNGKPEIEAQSPWLGGRGEYLTIGHRVDLCNAIGLHGRFDEVAVWDRALDDEEVRFAYLAAVEAPIVRAQQQIRAQQQSGP